MKWISSKQAAELGKSLAAIVLALVIGALFILVAGESPATAYSSLLKGALGTPQAVANTAAQRKRNCMGYSSCMYFFYKATPHNSRLTA